MPENNENDQPTDVVKREDYNKVVEAQNSAKVENEELKKKIEGLEEGKKVDEDKAEWQKEKEEIQKQMDELKKQVAEKKDATTVAKGIVTPKVDETEQKVEDPKVLLDKHLPDRKIAPEKFASRMAAYGHHKNPASKFYSSEQLGYAISLHASAQNVNPELLHNNTRRQSSDVIMGKKIH